MFNGMRRKKLLNNNIQLIHGLLKTIIPILLLVIGIITPSKIDQLLLLEKWKPTYWQWLGNVYIENDTETGNCIAYVSKDGFGGVTPTDFAFFLKSVQKQNPNSETVVLEFTDGTGIYVKKEDSETAVYGTLNDRLVVDLDAKIIDLTKPLLSQIDGLTTIQYQYDDHNHPIHMLRLDTSGAMVADSDGVAEYYRAYDADNNIIWEKRLGADGLPVCNTVGYAEVRRRFENNKLIWEAYYDGEGHSVLRNDLCYASIEIDHDAKGNRIREQYFGVEGKLCVIPEGYASLMRTFDEDGRILTEAYYGENGNPIKCNQGYAVANYAYAEGNKVSEAFYGVAGEPVNNLNGYARVEREFDVDNNLVLQRFLDENGHYVVTGSGYAEVRRRYDGQYLISEQYYGADGMPLLCDAGFTAIEQTWIDDRLASRTYLDVNGKPVNRTDGYSKVVWEDEGECVNVRFFDIKGKEIENAGINLAKDIHIGTAGWSDWIVPNYNTFNSCQNIGSVNLGPKSNGDVYTCQIEIEFRGVTVTKGKQFCFWTQGSQDKRWFTGNVWAGVIVLDSAPEDGVYRYTYTNTIYGDMVEVSNFDIGFRCDYWASGAYRVRCIKIEKGDFPTEWTYGL